MTETRWIGQINGSRVGNVFWTENDQGQGLFTLRQPDGAVLKLKATVDSTDQNLIELTSANPTEEGDEQSLGELQLEDRSGSHRAGTWKFADDSTGTFEVIIKEIGASASPTNPVEKSQVQISNKEISLGAITLYRADLDRIISELSSYFEDPVVAVIRAKEGDQVIARNAAEYLARGDLPDMVKELTIGIERDAQHGLKKIVNLVLSDDLDSRIVVSSPDELWTEAVASRLSRYMEEFTGTFTGFLRRHGLNINFFMLIALVIALPEFEITSRIIVAGLALILMLLVARTHKLVPFARIFLDPDRARRPYAKEFPSVIMGLIGAATLSALTALPKIASLATSLIERIGQALGL